MCGNVGIYTLPCDNLENYGKLMEIVRMSGLRVTCTLQCCTVRVASPVWTFCSRAKGSRLLELTSTDPSHRINRTFACQGAVSAMMSNPLWSRGRSLRTFEHQAVSTDAFAGLMQTFPSCDKHVQH